MKDKYYEQAVTCVKDTVLPAQIRLSKSCGGDFDIILVFPLWWWTLPVPVEEYIRQIDLQGKTIYCIVTHGGSGLGSSISDLKEITNGTVSDNALTVMDQDVVSAFPEVLDWIRGW